MDCLSKYTDAKTIESFSKLFALSDQPSLVFDLGLTRGMEYYTGIIYEVVYFDPLVMPSSIAAGGRYDNMIGKLSKKNVPAIGLSIGVERIVRILEQTRKIPDLKVPIVYVAGIGNSPTVMAERMKV